jgi:transketolase
MISNSNEFLIDKAYQIRKSVIESIFVAQTGHAGPSLSMVEILVMIYFRYLKYDNSQPHCGDRDYFILSKGHGAPSYYATLAHAGFFPIEELNTLRKLGSRLQGHPNAHSLPGVDISTGSLGQGFSIGVGLALGFKHQGKPNKVFCILGDGELQEGQNWEAAMASSAFGLSNLIIIIDRNKIQSDGFTEEIMPLGDLVSKFKAFGLSTYEINGHDLEEINLAFSKAFESKDKPTVIIANTIKGKGVSFMEGKVKWHHFPLNKEEYEQAINDLERGTINGNESNA